MGQKLNILERRSRDERIIARYNELQIKAEPMPFAVLAAEFPELPKPTIVSIVRRYMEESK